MAAPLAATLDVVGVGVEETGVLAVLLLETGVVGVLPFSPNRNVIPSFGLATYKTQTKKK